MAFFEVPKESSCNCSRPPRPPAAKPAKREVLIQHNGHHAIAVEVDSVRMVSGKQQAMNVLRQAELQTQTLDDDERVQIQRRRSVSEARRQAAISASEQRSAMGSELQEKLGKQLVALERMTTTKSPEHASSQSISKLFQTGQLSFVVGTDQRRSAHRRRAVSDTHTRSNFKDSEQFSQVGCELQAKLAKRFLVCDVLDPRVAAATGRCLRDCAVAETQPVQAPKQTPSKRWDVDAAACCSKISPSRATSLTRVNQRTAKEMSYNTEVESELRGVLARRRALCT